MDSPKMRQVERQARRMHDMMDRLNVDAGKLVRLDQGDAYAAARARCLTCCETERCLNWLETPPADNDQPDFCPNVELLKMVASPGN